VRSDSRRAMGILRRSTIASFPGLCLRGQTDLIVRTLSGILRRYSIQERSVRISPERKDASQSAVALWLASRVCCKVAMSDVATGAVAHLFDAYYNVSFANRQMEHTNHLPRQQYEAQLGSPGVSVDLGALHITAAHSPNQALLALEHPRKPWHLSRNRQVRFAASPGLVRHVHKDVLVASRRLVVHVVL
jgi:hypothetical protein